MSDKKWAKFTKSEWKWAKLSNKWIKNEQSLRMSKVYKEWMKNEQNCMLSDKNEQNMQRLK